jgi:hypothetical protein
MNFQYLITMTTANIFSHHICQSINSFIDDISKCKLSLMVIYMPVLMSEVFNNSLVHTHMHVHARTHTCTRARTHTHTYAKVHSKFTLKFNI